MWTKFAIIMNVLSRFALIDMLEIVGITEKVDASLEVYVAFNIQSILGI